MKSGSHSSQSAFIVLPMDSNYIHAHSHVVILKVKILSLLGMGLITFYHFQIVFTLLTESNFLETGETRHILVITEIMTHTT